MFRKDRRLALAGIGGVSIVAVTLRALSLLEPGGAVGSGAFDDGVYYSAAALATEGVAPYRDFVLLHPPGIIWLLSPLGVAGDLLVGHADAFAGGRWFASFIGGINTALTGLLALRWRGGTAGFVAAILYALFPPAVSAERTLLLEPFLILVLLGAVWYWLSGPSTEADERTRLVATGLLLALATSIKLYGGVILVACLLAGPFRRALGGRVLLLASFAAGLLFILVPFVAWAGVRDVVGQVLLTGASRPSGGGDVSSRALDRAVHMVLYVPWGKYFEHPPAILSVSILVSFTALAATAWVRGGLSGRLFGSWWVLVAVMLLFAPSYYDQYPVTLAPATSLLVGAAAQRLKDRSAGRQARVRALAGIVALLFVVFTIYTLARREGERDVALGFGAAVQENVPKDACLYTDRPVLALAGGRLPSASDRCEPFIDPYGELLDAARQSGDRYPTAEASFDSPSAQARLTEALKSSDYVALAVGPRKHHTWSRKTRAHFFDDFERIAASKGPRWTLWRRRER